MDTQASQPRGSSVLGSLPARKLQRQRAKEGRQCTCLQPHPDLSLRIPLRGLKAASCHGLPALACQLTALRETLLFPVSCCSAEKSLLSWQVVPWRAGYPPVAIVAPSASPPYPTMVVWYYICPTILSGTEEMIGKYLLKNDFRKEHASSPVS